MSSVATAASIGPYQTIRQLGSGGMGEVFLAHDDSLDRELAIKLLPEHLAGDHESLERLRQEARSASALNHPNIITIYEIGKHEHGAFVAMEYIDGSTLRELMYAGAVPVRKALQIAAQIADGLAAAHKRGLVHRDLKPENIMITSDGVVKILDFGLAKFEGPGNNVASDPGTIVGSYGYMAPEQARAAAVDYRADQFSLGAILYEMLTGRRAFDGASGVETLFMIVRDEPLALSSVAPHVPAPVRWVVDRCLSKDPDDRYVATRDLARELQYIRDHYSEAGVQTPIRDTEAEATPRPKRTWAVVALVLAALSIGALTTAFVHKTVPRTITAERYLTYSGNDYSPAVSPDGKLIAFSSNRDGKQRIWLKQVDGGNEVALTADGDDFPRFSPDGAMVLYTHALNGQPASLWRVPVVGGEARRLVNQANTGEWSRDGKQLAFTRLLGGKDSATSVLMVANADGSGAREIARSPATLLLHPRWSPDDKSIAVTGSRGRVSQMVTIVDVATAKSRVLAEPPKAGEVSSVVWSDDGASVIYVRADSVEAVVGSTAHVIRHHVQDDTFEVIGWSSHNGSVLDVLADGTLVFDVRSPRDNLRELPLTGGTTAEQWITRGNSSDRQPVYAPDGKTVLFTSNRSGNLDLWTISRDSGTVRRITDDAAEDWDPAFTPDGQHIVWSSGRSGHLEIWTANADGSEARQVSTDGIDAENPSATPDGQWVVYNSFNGDKSGIFKVHRDGSGTTRLIAGRTAVPELSPDGQYVAYLADARTADAGIRVARLADGKDTGYFIRCPATRRTTAIIGRMRWMPDGKALAFLAQDENGVNGVFVQDFEPGKDTIATRRQLGGFDRERATESFGIARDGKSLTVAGWEQLFSLFSIEGVSDVKSKRSDKRES